MTANRIKQIAVHHFAQYGYEGASLHQIAQEVGIKKPSIYAHYTGKEELFFACLDDAIREHSTIIHQFLEQNHELPTEQLLYQFLAQFEDRSNRNAETRFLLRSFYFPPDPLKDRVIDLANQYIINIGQLFRPIFAKCIANAEMITIDAHEAVEAYLCLLDGLMIELLYSGVEGFQKRLSAAWKVFSKGLFQNSF